MRRNLTKICNCAEESKKPKFRDLMIGDHRQPAGKYRQVTARLERKACGLTQHVAGYLSGQSLVRGAVLMGPCGLFLKMSALPSRCPDRVFLEAKGCGGAMPPLPSEGPLDSPLRALLQKCAARLGTTSRRARVREGRAERMVTLARRYQGRRVFDSIGSEILSKTRSPHP